MWSHCKIYYGENIEWSRQINQNEGIPALPICKKTILATFLQQLTTKIEKIPKIGICQIDHNSIQKPQKQQLEHPWMLKSLLTN